MPALRRQAEAASVLDFHLHILPGVDDGAPDLATALAMLRALRDQGVDQAVATPHWRSPRFTSVDEARIAAAWAELTAAAAEVPGVALHLGAENHCTGVGDAEDFAAKARPLGKSAVVLVEFPDDHLPPTAWTCCFALRRRGLRPVIAHPERCKGLRGQRAALADFVADGGLLQLTAGSLAGRHGWMMRWRSRRLAAAFPAACVVASDSHDLAARRPAWDALPARYRGLAVADLAALAGRSGA